MKYDNLSNRDSFRSEAGFSVIELFMVVAIISVITVAAVIGVTRARTSTEFANTGRTFQAYVERAVSDAKRRRALGPDRAKIEVLDMKRYRVTADFDENGNVESKTIELPVGITFDYLEGKPPSATIDWRGNVDEGDVAFKIKAADGTISEIKVMNKGGVNMGTELPTLPTVSGTPISTDVKSRSSIGGPGTVGPDPSPTPVPTPLPFCIGNQSPIDTVCRCKPGQTLDSKKLTCRNN
jgi:type II secretory pathway pseudopilin PulG